VLLTEPAGSENRETSPSSSPKGRPAQVAPADIPGVRSLLTLAVGVVVIAGLYFAREILIPITLAVLLSFLLAPLVNRLRRLHLGRVPSVLIAVLFALGIILGFGGLIGTQLADLAGQMPRYQATIETKLHTLHALTLGMVNEIAQRFGPHAQEAPRAQPENPAGAGGNSGVTEPKPIPVEVHQPGPSPLETAGSILAPVVSPVATAAIVFVVTIFILLQREDLRDRLIRLFGSADLHRTTIALDDAGSRLSRYFLTQLGINVGFDCVIGTGLAIIGVPNPLLWGILSSVLRFLPYVGVPIAALLPVAVSAAVSPGWWMAIWTASLYFVSELITGQAIEPLLYGRSTGLSPVSVVVAATFWTWLWGPIGLILSTPLTLCVVVLGRHVQRLEFLDVLLGDRPALTPVQSFYQRMLADDPDEAAQQAELLLKDCALSSYYDEVAMKGLQLASADVARGTLTPDRLEAINRAVASLVGDLDDHDDRDPPVKKTLERDDAPVTLARVEQAVPQTPAPSDSAASTDDLPDKWRTRSSVLCIAGRGPVDEAVATMLQQLLAKHGIGGRIIPHGEVSRTTIARLDTREAMMACICCLELEGVPAHVRYLARRLRQRLPARPILVGMWPPDDRIMWDEATRSTVGADYCVASLRDAVEACLQAARRDAAGSASRRQEELAPQPGD